VSLILESHVCIKTNLDDLGIHRPKRWSLRSIACLNTTSCGENIGISSWYPIQLSASLKRARLNKLEHTHELSHNSEHLLRPVATHQPPSTQASPKTRSISFLSDVAADLANSLSPLILPYYTTFTLIYHRAICLDLRSLKSFTLLPSWKIWRATSWTDGPRLSMGGSATKSLVDWQGGRFLLSSSTPPNLPMTRPSPLCPSHGLGFHSMLVAHQQNMHSSNGIIG
jgi:hypothetical protein